MENSAGKRLLLLWEEGSLPILNGLLKADGTFFDVALQRDAGGTLNDIKVQLPCATKGQAEKYWNNTSCVETVSQPLPHANHRYYCGGGSWGGDGWVLALNDKGGVEWLFFHERMNPAEQLHIEGSHLYITNNLQERFMFRLDKPEEIEIQDV